MAKKTNRQPFDRVVTWIHVFCSIRIASHDASVTILDLAPVACHSCGPPSGKQCETQRSLGLTRHGLHGPKNEALKDWSNSMWWILVMDRKAETSSHQRSKYLYADMFLILVGIFRINSHLFSEIWTLFPIESSFSDEFWTCYWGFIPWPWVCMARSRWLLGHTFGLRTRRFGIFVWVLKIQNPSLQVLKMSTWRALI